MDSQRYESLSLQLGGYYENSFLELDANLQSRVRDVFFPDWDILSAEQRRVFAINYDYQHDPKLESVLYFELIQFMDELSSMEASARKESKAEAALAIVDIATRIKSLLDTDRETVGREIQELRSKVAIDENKAQIDIFDATSTTYPPELDIAIQAWQAVSSSEAKAKPKARIRAWLDANTALTNEAKDRISIIANWDKLGGATRTD